MAKKEARERAKLKRGKCRQGSDEEATEDDDDDDDINEEKEEEEWDEIPWDELARDDAGPSVQPSVSAQAPFDPTPTPTHQASCTHGGDRDGSRHPVSAGAL
jgi:hypothetical protein